MNEEVEGSTPGIETYFVCHGEQVDGGRWDVRVQVGDCQVYLTVGSSYPDNARCGV